MTDQLFIGIDSGTQGTKAVVLSKESGEILTESYAGYGLIENPRGGKEQDPASWIEACQHVIAKVLSHPDVTPSLVKGIGVSGQQHGMVPLDKSGKVIRAAKLWCDTETEPECRAIRERAGGAESVFNLIGNQVATGFTASKILWLKEHEPANYERLDTVLLPHDYINFWLTGEKSTEFGDASGTAYFDVKNRLWSPALLKAIDESGQLESCLPKCIESDSPIGELRADLALSFGLPSGVLVSSGGGDNMMAAIGTGNVKEGIVTTSLGTSGTIYAYSDNPVTDRDGELAAFCSSTGGWLPLVCTMNVTASTELVRNLFTLDLIRMNEMATKVAPGSEGLLLLPYFNGERTPALPNAKATLSGMDSMNLRPETFCRAAMEGATFGLRYGLNVLKRNGIVPKEIRLTGGGAKSLLWRQMVADVFNSEVVCLQQEEAGATGAALQALWCVENSEGGRVSIEEITSKYISLDEATRLQPQSDTVTVYDGIFEKYLELNKAMTILGYEK